MAVRRGTRSRRDARDPVQLVRAAQRGDRSAFEQLYMRFADMVRGVALSSVPPRDAGDVVQESFLRALRHLKTLRDARRFGAWLKMIARRTAIEVRRQSMRESALDTDIAHPGTQHEEVQANSAIEAIRRLPCAYRDTVRMRLIEGMSGREIAARTGLTAASVRVNLHRGLKLLREAASGARARELSCRSGPTQSRAGRRSA